MAKWKKGISEGLIGRILSKGKGKQSAVAEHAPAEPSPSTSATRPIVAANEGEQQPPSDLEETLLPSTPADDPALGRTNANPTVPASTSVGGAPLSVENFGLFEFPERNPLAGKAVPPSPAQNARHVEYGM